MKKKDSFKEAVGALVDIGVPVIDLSNDVDHPTFLVQCKGDEAYSEILEAIWTGNQNLLRDQTFEVIRPADDADHSRIEKTGALLWERLDQHQYGSGSDSYPQRSARQQHYASVQLVAKPTQSADSVLGRIGAVDILRHHLARALRPIGFAEDLSLANAIAFLSGSMFEANGQGYGAAEKRISRSNRGEYVKRFRVSTQAEALGVHFKQVGFEVPAIYSKKAWKELRERRAQRRLEQFELLKKFRVPLARVDPRSLSSVASFIQAVAQGSSRPRFDFDDSLKGDERSAVMNLVGLLSQPNGHAREGGEIDKVMQALGDLGVAIWFGQYEKLCLSSEALTHSSWGADFDMELGTVVVFRANIDVLPPIVTVDVSAQVYSGDTLSSLHETYGSN